MHYRKPNRGQVATVFNDLFKRMKFQVQDEHQQSWMKLQGFFRQHLKMMLPYHLTSLTSTGLKTGYSGAKSLVQFVLKQTIGNLPFGGTITTVINGLYSIAEAGVSFVSGIARTKLIANLAKRDLMPTINVLFHNTSCTNIPRSRGLKTSSGVSQRSNMQGRLSQRNPARSSTAASSSGRCTTLHGSNIV